MHKIRRRAKSGRDFARIKYADASAAPSTDIKQAATISQRFSHDLNRADKSCRRVAQGVLNQFFFLHKHFDELLCAHFLQVL